jgi:hypothetical protein
MLNKKTKDLLIYLRDNSAVRQQIRAPHDQTLLYAGHFFKPMWREIIELKHKDSSLSNKVILPELLAKIQIPGSSSSMLSYVNEIEKQVPWNPDGFTIWRALSGIFASNATGKVSFQIGSGISTADKVFAATEVGVLLRNPNVNATTKNLVTFYQRCIRNGISDINFGFITV